VNAFLFALAKEKNASSTYFKHAVYGLRFFFRLYGLEDRALSLPTTKNDRKLPFILTKKELRRLLSVPLRLKYKVMLSLIYSAGLRVS
jgi:integrase/recombinase XerD